MPHTCSACGRTVRECETVGSAIFCFAPACQQDAIALEKALAGDDLRTKVGHSGMTKAAPLPEALGTPFRRSSGRFPRLAKGAPGEPEAAPGGSGRFGDRVKWGGTDPKDESEKAAAAPSRFRGLTFGTKAGG